MSCNLACIWTTLLIICLAFYIHTQLPLVEVCLSIPRKTHCIFWTVSGIVTKVWYGYGAAWIYCLAWEQSLCGIAFSSAMNISMSNRPSWPNQFFITGIFSLSFILYALVSNIFVITCWKFHSSTYISGASLLNIGFSSTCSAFLCHQFSHCFGIGTGQDPVSVFWMPSWPL